MPLYNRELDVWRAVASTDLQWLLLQGSGYVFDPDHDYVAAVAAHEVTATGYARQLLLDATRTVDDAGNRVVYEATDPSFGSVDTGEDVTGLVLYRFVTDDDDSPLVAYWPLPATDTAEFDPLTVHLTGGVLAEATEG